MRLPFWEPFLCARQGTLLGSESLLWAVMTGTMHLGQGLA